MVYTFGAFVDPAYVSPFKGAFRVLQSVTALDDYTVEFRLKTPFAAFPAQLVLQPPVVPAGSGDTIRTFPIGTGPYRFVEYAADDHVTLSAFEGYFDGLPNNAGLVLKVVPDDTMRGLELRHGSLDVVVNDLPPDIVHQLRREETLQSTTSPGLDFSYVGVNMRDPMLADRRVRHAIGYAIDRQAIVDHLRRGLARLAIGLVPSQAWAYEPDVEQFTYDPARAQALLDEAGYRDPDGSGPLPRLRLSLICSTNEETRLQSTIIQEDLRRVGIDLEVRSYEFATFYQDVLQRPVPAVQRCSGWAARWSIPTSCAASTTRRRYRRPASIAATTATRRWIGVLDAAAAATSEADRRRWYSEAQRLVARDAVYIPIWNKTNVVVARRSLAGLHVGATGDLLGLRDVTRVTSR